MINTTTLDLLLRALDSRPADLQPVTTPLPSDPTRVQVRLTPPGPLFLPENGVIGTVVARLADSLYQVSIGGQTYRLTLPSQLSLMAGDTVSLQLGAAGQPGPELTKATLGSLEPEAPASPISSRQVGTPAGDEPTNGSVSMKLSEVGLWLANAPNQTTVKAPAHIRAEAPLLPSPTDVSVEIGHALQHAISKSGLFYESHVAAWAVQDYPKSALGIEPQSHPTEQARLMASVFGPLATMPSPSTTWGPLDTHHLVPPLMREQLQALESHSLIWQGDLWPGQRASIEIAEDDTSRQAGFEPDSPASAWRVQVKLDLPELGMIDATIGLSANSVQIRINSTKEGAAEVLRSAVTDFADVMQRRELLLESIVVQNEPA